MLGKKEITVTIAWNWLLLIFAIAVGMIAVFVWGRDAWHPALIFAAAVLASAAALTSAANALDSRGAQAQQARIVAAMGYIDRWNSPTFFHCKKNGRAVIDHFKSNPQIDAQLLYLSANVDARANLIDVLNLFEALEIGIRRNVIDEDTVRDFFRSVVIQYWHTTEGYIKNRRAERNNARLQKEFEALYQRWKD